ncbi:MAG TPA: hypothetical protein PKL71_10185 [Marmoricola sp.]|nr:hypothetical protein [Marmoricola sp.]
MAAATPQRRRQRSVRVTVAVLLLAVATAVVIIALPTQSAFWLSLASVGAIIFSWAALRIMWTEVLQTRREHARDRAATANAYKSLYAERAADHAEFTSVMTERLAQSNQTQRELEQQVVIHQRAAAESIAKLAGTNAELSQARERVAELEQSLAAVRAEEAEALSEWIAEGEPSVEALAEWEASQAARHRASAGTETA